MSRQGRIGFISTRLAGTDGVSLEAVKWVNVLEKMGHTCFFFAGESEWPTERSYVVPEAHFNHPEILALNVQLFEQYRRSPEASLKIEKLHDHLKDHLHRFVRQYELEVLVVENALSLPMNIPLGLALTELIAETGLFTIAHHHDFTWERTRFAITAADDYLRAAFPPTLFNIHHVVINSFASRQLALRTGVSSTIIPNVMDFDNPPNVEDEYNQDLRQVLGLADEQYLLLQPTRIVPRKRIELAIELARRLDLACALVITHHAGDEGVEYQDYLENYAQMLNVDVRFAAHSFALLRDETEDGSKVYSLADAYHWADLVTYPSLVEGFGNAFLEAVYYRKPLVMSCYEIFKIDIQPKGFQMVTFEEFLDAKAVQAARHLLEDPQAAQEMAEHNYDIARQHFSYAMLENRLDALMNLALGLG